MAQSAGSRLSMATLGLRETPIADRILSMQSCPNGADVRGCPPGRPQAARGQAVRPLRLDVARAGGAAALDTTGQATAGRQAQLLVLHRPGGLSGPLPSPPLPAGLSAAVGTGPLPPESRTRSPVPRVRTADALRPARRTPVVCARRCRIGANRPGAFEPSSGGSF
jgi:hypothetical protein